MTNSHFVARSGQSELFGRPIAMPSPSNATADVAGRLALALLPVAALATLFVGF